MHRVCSPRMSDDAANQEFLRAVADGEAHLYPPSTVPSKSRVLWIAAPLNHCIEPATKQAIHIGVKDAVLGLAATILGLSRNQVCDVDQFCFSARFAVRLYDPPSEATFAWTSKKWRSCNRTGAHVGT